MTVYRLSICGALAGLSTLAGCCGSENYTIIAYDAPARADLATAVRAATAHHQTPYASPRLTDRWRQRERFCEVARIADQLMISCNRCSAVELAAVSESGRPQTEQAALRVHTSLKSVRAAAEAGDKASLRQAYREFMFWEHDRGASPG